MPTVLIPIANGSEDIEAITLIDVLRRAQLTVLVASLDGQAVTLARGSRVLPDLSLDQVLKSHPHGQGLDAIALPGGQPGTQNLAADGRIIDLLRSMAKDHKITAAICAAPTVLAKAGLLNGKKATSYPGTWASLRDLNITLLDSPSIWDGKVLTGKSAGTAMEFALDLVEGLGGRDLRNQVEAKLERI